MSKLTERLQREVVTWKPEPGEVLEGTCAEVGEYAGDFGSHSTYALVDDNGMRETIVHAGHRVLRDQLSHVQVGDRVAIKFEGKVKSKSGTEYANYRTVVEHANPTPAQAARAAQIEQEREIDEGLMFRDDEPPEDF